MFEALRGVCKTTLSSSYKVSKHLWLDKLVMFKQESMKMEKIIIQLSICATYCNVHTELETKQEKQNSIKRKTKN